MFLKFLLGNGKLKPELRDELEAEGLVLIEEGMVGSVRYDHYKAPGKSFNGKITGVCSGLGISERRLVLFASSGRAELIDSAFTEPRWGAVDVVLEGDDKVVFKVDYSRMEDAQGVEGVIRIRAKTPNAPRIVEELSERLGR